MEINKKRLGIALERIGIVAMVVFGLLLIYGKFIAR